jgi:hypothetical protein
VSGLWNISPKLAITQPKRVQIKNLFSTQTGNAGNPAAPISAPRFCQKTQKVSGKHFSQKCKFVSTDSISFPEKRKKIGETLRN